MEFKDCSAQSDSQNKETQEGEERPLDERVSAPVFWSYVLVSLGIIVYVSFDSE